MDVANDSVYDGASAVGEAVLMAQRLTRRDRVVLAGSVHPAVARGGARRTSPRATWTSSPHRSSFDAGRRSTREQRVVDLLDERTACVVVQQPDVFGHVRDLNGLAEPSTRRARC